MIRISELSNWVKARSRDRLNLRLVGEDVEVARFAPPADASAQDIAFLTDRAYADALKKSAAGVIVLREKDAAEIFGESLPERTFLFADDPYAFFAFATQYFFPAEHGEAGIDARAWVEEGAIVHESARVEAFAVVRRGANVGPRAVVKSGAYVDVEAVVSEGAVLMPGSYAGPRAYLGPRVVLNPGAVVGGDGFGYAPFKGEWVKIPQIGRAVLEADVEVGSNTTIDRGALGDTVVGEGTKLDNQIQLGHNDRVGKHCVMAACVGIAGSTTVGDNCMIGGAAMINGHIEIPSGSAVGPATAITGWGDKPAQKTGFFPALDGREFQLTAAMLTRLPDLRKQVKALEREVARLKAALEAPSS